MLISIEGNIGSGKSTLINFFKTLESDNIVFVDEPVNEWLNIKVNDKNALELFYENQKDNSFGSKFGIYYTTKELLHTIKNNKNKIIISERSIYTDKFVFAKMLYEMGYLSEIEWTTYNYWFDTFKDDTKLDLILYVNADPEESFRRIKIRNHMKKLIQYLLIIYKLVIKNIKNG